MKSLVTVLSLAMAVFSFTGIQAQPQSEFEVLKRKNDSDIVYRGPVTFEDIKKLPAFRFEEAAKEYTPNSKSVKAMGNRLNDYQLVVFLGTWCEDSHRMIPQLYKVLDAVQYPLEKLLLHAVDRDKHGKGDIAARYNITLVPTVIVLKDGNEIGRITEMPDKSIEQDLEKIIR